MTEEGTARWELVRGRTVCLTGQNVGLKPFKTFCPAALSTLFHSQNDVKLLKFWKKLKIQPGVYKLTIQYIKELNWVLN